MAGPQDNADHYRELLEAKICGVERWLEAELEGRDKANTIALRELERRLNGMNELRRQITAERGVYLTREMYDQKHDELEHTVGEIAGRLAALEGGNTVKASTFTWVIGISGVGIAGVVVIVNLLTGS